jgi:hypothetical protein
MFWVSRGSTSSATASQGGGSARESSPSLCVVTVLCESTSQKTEAPTFPPKCSGIELSLDVERRFSPVSSWKLHAGRAQALEGGKASDTQRRLTEVGTEVETTGKVVSVFEVEGKGVDCW